jgi:lipocalin
MAANSPVLESFEKDCFCATALYGPISAHNVSVHNYCAIASPKGAASIVDGYAWQPDPTTAPGQLKVLFNDEANAAPFPAPYWILALGPRDTNNQYAWSIVSDNLSVSLFVLARNATSYESTYKAEVNTLLKKLGFTGFRAPIDVYQGSDCVYDAK